MYYDNLCKYLAEQYPAQFIRWLLTTEAADIRVLKTELGNEPIRADALTFLQTSNQLLHLEFQTRPDADMPLRMLDYWVRLYRQYRCSIEQVVIFLKPTTSELVFVEEFRVEQTWHGYRVIRLWEQDPAPLLADPALLPFAVLAQTNSPEALLEQVAAQVAMIEAPAERKSISTCTQVLAGLRFEKELIRTVFREELMQESVIYQDILQKGLQQGMQKGELKIILSLLARQLGSLPPDLQAQIQQLSLARLEALGEALLDFSTLEDLSSWLRAQS
ncbi:Rpn family recombination-promoting nuclease/putative transposase [Leptolyngbya sp. FACHB-261]|nr:Rpn family recombination-promoting nuclease/putative transposase [Leptolyngbya sp. FACHB-261]